MYATYQEVDTYVDSYYSSNDPYRVAWHNLDRNDQLSYIRRASQQIDLLPLSGVPLGTNAAFPRNPGGQASLEAAKQATCELAIRLSAPNDSDRYELQRQGVRSYKIGDLSETFGGDFSATDYGADPYILSIVFPFLKAWLGGGYRLVGGKRCRTRI